MKKEQAFGYGKAKYQREEDFPYELDYNGCHWYRTTYNDTYDREEDLRLYVDAAGNIWDEKESGIL